MRKGWISRLLWSFGRMGRGDKSLVVVLIDDKYNRIGS
jgi:hypothetical protein